MLRIFGLTFALLLALAISGCPPTGGTVPTVSKFTGRVVFKGEPVSFPANQDVVLKVITQKDGKAYNIPLKEDGTFEIGWMPVGKCSLVLTRKKQAKFGASVPQISTPPDVEITSGVTNYDIELGPNFKPNK